MPDARVTRTAREVAEQTSDRFVRFLERRSPRSIGLRFLKHISAGPQKWTLMMSSASAQLHGAGGVSSKPTQKVSVLDI